MFVGAHPDDILLWWAAQDVLVQAGVPVSVILLSLGDMGVGADCALTTKEVKAMRKKEDAAAMHELFGIENVFHYSTSW